MELKAKTAAQFLETDKEAAKAWNDTIQCGLEAVGEVDKHLSWEYNTAWADIHSAAYKAMQQIQTIADQFTSKLFPRNQSLKVPAAILQLEKTLAELEAGTRNHIPYVQQFDRD